jgi:hypothetical protein
MEGKHLSAGPVIGLTASIIPAVVVMIKAAGTVERVAVEYEEMGAWQAHYGVKD